jgi:ketosteroid isomerase-like protein
VKIHRTVPAALAAVALLSFAGAARAQTPVPTLHAEEARTAYRAETMRDVNLLLGEWREAWSSNDFRGLVRTYSHNGLLVMPGDTARAQGSRAIEQMLRARVPHLGEVRFKYIDSEPGDELLYMLQRFEIDPAAPDSAGAPAGAPLTGTVTFVFQRGDAGWKIRSQLFVLDPAAPPRLTGGGVPVAESPTAPHP